MEGDNSVAYILSRRGKSRSRRRSRGTARAAGVFVTLLLSVSVAICLLVVFLPRGDAAVTASAYAERSYYFLATALTEDKQTALLAAKDASARGGAGYIYNDGRYHVVAAVYERESEAKALEAVNADSHCFSLVFSGGTLGAGDKRVVEYLFNEWFDRVFTAASELERGNITEAAAEHAVAVASESLVKIAYRADSEALCRAVTDYGYDFPASESVLSRIRNINVGVIMRVFSAMS